MIRTVRLTDAATLANIYNYYVENTIITFEEESISEQTFRSRIQTSIEQQNLWLVLEDQNEIVGYAYSSPWKSRSAYQYTHEITIYLNPEHAGKGFGSTLVNSLLLQLKNTRVRNLIAIIALPNEASIALHEKLGMEKVAHFSKVGYKFSEWIDVGYWQLSFPLENE